MNDSPRRGRRDGQTAFLLTQVGEQAASSFAQVVGELGLTPPHAGLLRAIALEPGRSQQQIAARLGMLPSRLVALVDELEAKGLVQRGRNPDDRRQHALGVTAAGEAMLREIGRLAQIHGEKMLSPLTLAERRLLDDLLGKLSQHHGLTPGVHPGYRTLGRPTSYRS